MRKIFLFIISVFASISMMAASYADTPFSKEEFLLATGSVMPYRKMQVEGQDKALVIYLHGGSSCGTDNEVQMGESGIDSIANYLVNHNIASTFIVPQCADRTKGWGGICADVKALLDYVAENDGCSTGRIYILGGSMGGTGTWKMLSTYPDYFAAAMPCAANPKGMNAQSVATTPVYTVMGLADMVMGEDVRTTAENFTNQLKHLGDDVVYETVEGWTHEITCIQSYTNERLDWIFSHTRDKKTDINRIHETYQISDGCYDLQGRRIVAVPSKGIYIRNRKKFAVTQ